MDITRVCSAVTLFILFVYIITVSYTRLPHMSLSLPLPVLQAVSNLPPIIPHPPLHPSIGSYFLKES